MWSKFFANRVPPLNSLLPFFALFFKCFPVSLFFSGTLTVFIVVFEFKETGIYLNLNVTVCSVLVRYRGGNFGGSTNHTRDVYMCAPGEFKSEQCAKNYTCFNGLTLFGAKVKSHGLCLMLPAFQFRFEKLSFIFHFYGFLCRGSYSSL